MCVEPTKKDLLLESLVSGFNLVVLYIKFYNTWIICFISKTCFFVSFSIQNSCCCMKNTFLTKRDLFVFYIVFITMVWIKVLLFLLRSCEFLIDFIIKMILRNETLMNDNLGKSRKHVRLSYKIFYVKISMGAAWKYKNIFDRKIRSKCKIARFCCNTIRFIIIVDKRKRSILYLLKASIKFIEK